MTKKRVLVVEDEPSLRRALEVNLNAKGYEPQLAADGETALRLAAASTPDLVLLDLGLPGIDGVDVIRALRKWSLVPIVVLSARGDEQQRVEALDGGADDFVAKPFGLDELFARIRASLRRSAATLEDDAIVHTPHFEIDLFAHRVRDQNGEVHLTPTQWGIIEILSRNRNRLVSQRAVLQAVWGPAYEGETHYLRVYLNQIRRKLEPDPSNPRYFITEPGVGYRFEVATEFDSAAEKERSTE